MATQFSISQMLVDVCFLGPKTKIRVILIKFYKN